MTQEQSHPDQEGDTDNRRRRQSGQVTQQGALLSGRPAGLPTRAAARSAPALIGVTADEHWVNRRGPTYALLLIANQRPAAPSPLRAGPTPGRREPEPGRGAKTFPAPSIPREETAANARHVQGARARRRARRPSGPEYGPEAHPECRPQAPPRVPPASTAQSAARRPIQGAPAGPPGRARQTHPAPAGPHRPGIRRPAWGRPWPTPEAPDPQATLGPPAGHPGAADRLSGGRPAGRARNRLQAHPRYLRRPSRESRRHPSGRPCGPRRGRQPHLLGRLRGPSRKCRPQAHPDAGRRPRPGRGAGRGDRPGGADSKG